MVKMTHMDEDLSIHLTKNLICDMCKHTIINENIIVFDETSSSTLTYINEMIFFQSCDHFFCRRCLINTILQSFMTGVYVINCPEIGCKKNIDFDDVIKIINHDVNLYANFIDNYVDTTITMSTHKSIEASDSKLCGEILPGHIIETTKNDPNCNTTCSICGDTFYINQFHFVDNCAHLFCLSCYSSYLEIKINEGETDIKCMAINCNELLTYNDIIKVISENQELSTKYERFLLKKTFEDQVIVTKYKKKILRKTDGSLVPIGINGEPLKQKKKPTKFYNKSSDSSDSDDSDASISSDSDFDNNSDENYIEDFEEYIIQTKIIVCPKCSNFMEIEFDEKRKKEKMGGHVVRCSNSACKYVWCSYCKVSHNESTCDTYLQLLKAQNFDEWREIKGDLIRDCPNCNWVIEKNQGCNHMTCQKCKKGFCWVCGYLQMSGDWSHKKCSGKWDVTTNKNTTTTTKSLDTNLDINSLGVNTNLSKNVPITSPKVYLPQSIASSMDQQKLNFFNQSTIYSKNKNTTSATKSLNTNLNTGSLGVNTNEPTNLSKNMSITSPKVYLPQSITPIKNINMN